MYTWLGIERRHIPKIGRVSKPCLKNGLDADQVSLQQKELKTAIHPSPCAGARITSLTLLTVLQVLYID